MIKKFTELTHEHSQEFLRHFKAIIRDSETGMIKGDGSGSLKGDLWVTEQNSSFKYRDSKLFVVWKIVQTTDGRVLSIENINTLSPESESVVSDLIVDVLERVITKKKGKFYQRTYLRAFADSPLNNEFWVDGFRFAQLYPNDDCHVVNAERLYVIDQNVQAVDAIHAEEIAREESAKISAYLSLILNIGIEEHTREFRYFLERGKKGYKMERESTQIIDEDARTQFPNKGEICPQARFKRSVFDKSLSLADAFTLPSETRKIFRKIAQSRPEIRSTFYSACRMYQHSLVLGHRRPTIKASYQYGAIDSIVHSDKKLYGSFSEFMKKYSEANSAMCDVLHSTVRSAHWHSGSFPLGEYSFQREGSIYQNISGSLFIFSLESQQLMRKAILNWLDEQIDFSSSV